jgi:cell surface protein SprA
LPISYNTLANFDWENQLKLDYTGGPDEIIKKIEAGNVNFTTPSTLMTGAQSLFGIKTKLQFGKLTVTAVLANQRSQKQSVNSAGGAAVTNFSFKADNYDENRHFLLAQYFHDNFNTAMSNLPVVTLQGADPAHRGLGDQPQRGRYRLPADRRPDGPWRNQTL